MSAVLAPAQAPPARNGTVLIAFTAVTNLADGVLKVALPMLAVGLAASPAQIAAVGFALTLPWLLAALHVGVLVDRLDRRVLLGAANAARIAAVAGILTAHLTGAVSLPLIYAAALAVGVTDVIAATALGAIVPGAVPDAKLPSVNAWLTGAETVANEFAGPALGGLLIGLGAAVSLGATAVAYVLGVVVLLALARVARPVAPETARRSVHGDIKEGLRFVWGHPLLRTMTITIAVLITCWSAFLALLPSYTTGDLGISTQAYGLILGAIGAGGLVGVALVRPIERLIGRRRTLFLDLVGTFAMVALPAVHPHPVVIGVGAFLGGMGGTLWSVTARTISQRLVPAHMYGRYSASARLLGWGTLPLGAAAAGALAELIGPRVTFGVFAVVVALFVVPFLRHVTPAALTD
ncbi:MFS transporter [Actinorhabdospora filicis]|uniref:MFS transporter n=1 Tax=Actinorhabdospora filicis TaxID=1785913 RepID=A0A9W6SRE7_9ACTN|nr:MFS transporter [Actinorhabdospora filicis]GLZ81565.1 MFS transporter [Actinorhabdospora filicis]